MLTSSGYIPDEYDELVEDSKYFDITQSPSHSRKKWKKNLASTINHK